MIKIIEKEPYKSFDKWNNQECLMYPTIMIKDGKERFIFNRREPDTEYSEKEKKKILEILLKTNKEMIFESNDNGGNVSVSNVTFSIDKGLFLKPSNNLLEDEDYSTLIIWSIEE